MITFEFINHDKVTFFLARTFPDFPHFPRQVKHVRLLPFDFALERERERERERGRERERDPKSVFYYQRDIEDYTKFAIFYYLIDVNICTQNLLVCNFGQYIYVTSSFNFSFVL